MGKFDRMPDEEIEQLLDGTSDDPDLEALRLLLEELRGTGTSVISEDVVLAYVDNAVTASLRPAAPGRRDIPEPSRRHVHLARRPAVVGFISALTLVVGMSGVAWAANSSKPGDSFYALDRAFEAIGIGNGGTQERLSEIRALFVAGDLARILEHVTNVIPEDANGTSDAAKALRAAAESMQQRGIEPSEETLSAMSELLDYLTENLDGVDATEITKFAGHIRTRGFEPPEAGLTPADPTDPSGFREDG